MEKLTRPIAVLGAGVAGLAAARRLRSAGREVLLFEAADRVGGLAGGVRFNGELYEYGPHIFHTTDAEILADVKALMGEELFPYERTIQIKFLGNYFKFPLSVPDVLMKLPVTTVARAALSFAHRFVAGALIKPTVETSETVLQRYYGDVLYEIFFKSYIERVWGVSPAQFSPSFARERIPRFDFLDIVAKAAAPLRRALAAKTSGGTKGFVERVEGELWTTREGFALICDRMADDAIRRGVDARLSSRVVAIGRNGQRVQTVAWERAGRREEAEVAGVVNTLPINAAARMFEPGLGPEVDGAVGKLRFRAIVFVGLKVKRPRALSASFMYFREHSFNRVTDLAHFGLHMNPEGSTRLVAEITCDPTDRYWTDDAAAVEAVVADLVRENIIARDEVISSTVFRTRHGHPMYLLGYEAALKTLLDAFAGLENAETAGRQGRFQYVNTHVAMRMGVDAADRLLARV